MEALSTWIFSDLGIQIRGSFLFSIVWGMSLLAVIGYELYWCASRKEYLLAEGFFSNRMRDYLIWSSIPFFLFYALSP